MRFFALLVAMLLSAIVSIGGQYASAPDGGEEPPIVGPDPAPGMKYVLVYNTSDGTIVGIVRFPADGPGFPIAGDGQALLDITDQPVVVERMYQEGWSLWYVDPTTRQVVRRAGPVAEESPQSLGLIFALLAVISFGGGSIGVWRRQSLRGRTNPREKRRDSGK